jgi:uncharacterized protein (TIGR00730 family)
MRKTICIFCASSDPIDPAFNETAIKLGQIIGRKGFELVYGGGCTGLMGIVAHSVKASGGKVIGILPELMNKKGIACDFADEIHITKNMHDRKLMMEEKADAFIILPGGFGTMDELFEILSLTQLEYHKKPIIIINVNHFYDSLFQFLEEIYLKNFANESFRNRYLITINAEEAMELIEGHI